MLPDKTGEMNLESGRDVGTLHGSGDSRRVKWKRLKWHSTQRNTRVGALDSIRRSRLENEMAAASRSIITLPGFLLHEMNWVAVLGVRKTVKYLFSKEVLSNVIVGGKSPALE